MKYIKIYELFRTTNSEEMSKKMSLVFSILKTEHSWNFRSLKDYDIYKKNWICKVCDLPIGIKIYEKFSNLRYVNYLRITFLDMNIPDSYYSDINSRIRGRIDSHIDENKRCFSLLIDDCESEDIADDIDLVLSTIQNYLDGL
jgi:hypothetical protein